jgi:hypothetical protein
VPGGHHLDRAQGMMLALRCSVHGAIVARVADPCIGSDADRRVGSYGRSVSIGHDA